MHLAAYLGSVYGEGSTTVVDTDPNKSIRNTADRAAESGYRLPFGVVDEMSQVETEHIVFDSPGRLYKDELVAVGRISDLVVVPTTIDSLSIDALGAFVRDYRGQAGVGAAEFMVLLTMIPWWDYFRARQARQELTDVKVPMFSGWIRLRPAFSRAAEMGVPVYEIDTKGARDGWKDYQSVGEEALQHVGIGVAGDGGSL